MSNYLRDFQNLFGKFHFHFMKKEKYFFLAAVVFNLSVVFSGKFFPTLDGPAHLYNSQIIESLFLKNSEVLSQFYQFNSDLVPNWSGHFILAFFNYFLPASIAEKILLLFYLVGLPYAFRSLIKSVSKENYLLSYLIFPFTYSFVFILGFYNFSLAIVFMLFSINFWIRKEMNLGSYRNIFFMFLLLTATFFSHLVVFGMTVLIIALLIIFNELLITSSNRLNPNKERFKIILNKGFILGIAAMPALILSIHYFVERPSVNNVYTPLDQILEWVKTIHPIIAYNTEVERVFTSKLFYILISTFCLAILLRIVNSFSKKDQPSEEKFISINDVWLLVSVLFLILSIVLPDSNSTAGYVTVRFILLFFLLLIIWLACQKIPVIYTYAVVLSFLFLNNKLNNFYEPVISDLDKIAVDCADATVHIPDHSIVAVHSYLDNWLTNHFSSYLGIDKPIVILDNYESATDYFPIQWKMKSLPSVQLNYTDLIHEPCYKWYIKGNQNSKIQVDFIFLLGNSDIQPTSCDSTQFTETIKNAVLVYERPFCRLYKMK